MKRYLALILLLVPSLAFADTSNFPRVPSSFTRCATGMLTWPSVGSTITGLPNCSEDANDDVGVPYWNLSDDLPYSSSTYSLEASLVSRDASSSVIIGDKYLVTVMSSPWAVGQTWSYATCPRYIDNANGSHVGTNYNYIHSGSDNANGSSPYTGPPGLIVVWCAYEMNASSTVSNHFDFSTSTASRQPWSVNATGTNEGSFNAKMYAVFATSSPFWLYAPPMFYSMASTTAFLKSLDTFSGSGGVGSSEPSYLSCSGTLDIFCYLSNAFHYAFYPSTDAVSRISNLSLASSSPFSYVYDIGNLRNDLFNTATTSQLELTVPFHFAGHSTSTITLISKSMLDGIPMANTVRTLIGLLMWLLLAELIYYQILRVHNKEQK